jgi:hypothetical protein
MQHTTQTSTGQKVNDHVYGKEAYSFSTDTMFVLLSICKAWALPGLRLVSSVDHDR